MTGPVEAFLLDCLRAQWEPAALEAARTAGLDEAMDWRVLLNAAERERLGPVLYRILRGKGIAPAPVEQELHQAYRDTAIRNTFLLLRLEQALGALAGRGIPAILLKGAALSKTVFAGSPVRPMGDLDLLVRREAAPGALEALQASGWSRTGMEARGGLTLDYEVEIVLYRPGPMPAVLELHWGLLDSPYYERKLSADRLWETARPVRAGAQEALILEPVAEMLYLCAHLALHHRGQGLLWYNDIAATIAAEGERLPWQELIAMAQACDLVLPLTRCMLRLADEWRSPIPADVVARLRQLRPSAEESVLFERLTATERPVMQRFYTDLAAMAGWRARLGYAWSSLFPSPAYMRQRYGIARPALTPVYYPYRWFLGLSEAFSYRLSRPRNPS